MKYIHNKNIIHRDIKPSNIFISIGGDLVIGDFGLAIEMTKEEKELKGTTIYTAPELWNIETRKYTKASDIYAFGCVLYEIYTLHPAFNPRLERKVIENMIRTTTKIPFDRKEKSAIPCIEGLIHRMTEINPENRIDSEGIDNCIEFLEANYIHTEEILDADSSLKTTNINTAYMNIVVLFLIYYYYYYYRLIFILLMMVIKLVDVLMENNLEKYVN